MRRWWVAVAIFAVTPGGGFGGALQAQGAAELDRLESAIDAGDLDGARDRLDRWIEDSGDSSPEDVGRARFLRARLLTDADSARSEYLAVALEGRSSYGARAWLRLAQLDLARGQTQRAVEDLERLRADYPRSGAATVSWYWSARALESGGWLEDACSAFDRALHEANSAGDAVTGERAAEGRGACDPGGLRFSLQIGAFSTESAAESLATTARALGFPTRIVQEGGLGKVRVGLFGSADAARLLERRLRDDGFSVAVVAAES